MNEYPSSPNDFDEDDEGSDTGDMSGLESFKSFIADDLDLSMMAEEMQTSPIYHILNSVEGNDLSVEEKITMLFDELNVLGLEVPKKYIEAIVSMSITEDDTKKLYDLLCADYILEKKSFGELGSIVNLIHAVGLSINLELSSKDETKKKSLDRVIKLLTKVIQTYSKKLTELHVLLQIPASNFLEARLQTWYEKAEKSYQRDFAEFIDTVQSYYKSILELIQKISPESSALRSELESIAVLIEQCCKTKLIRKKLVMVIDEESLAEIKEKIAKISKPDSH